MNHRNTPKTKLSLGILAIFVAQLLLPAQLHAQDPPWIPASPFLDTLRSWLPSNARTLRFDVHTDGLLRIDAAWLRAAGADPSTFMSSQIKLYRLGKEIPLFRNGLDDGSFDDGDYLVFFGERPYDADYRQLPPAGGPYPERMFRYADSTAYWLQLDGGGSAAGLPQRPFLQPSANDTLRWLYHTIHLEDDRSLAVFGGNIDRINTFAWVENKTWVQSTLSRQSSAALIFPLPEMQAGEKSYFTAKLAGYQGEPAVSPNHSVQLRVNSSEARDSVQFDFGEQLFFSAAIPAGELREGVDTLWLDSYPRVAKYSVVALDWADLEYAHRLKANDGALQLREIPRVPQGKHLLELQGFASPDPLVLCLRGDTWAKLETRIRPDGTGGYSILVSDTLVNQMTIAASDVDRIPAAPAGELQTISDPLASAAEYLILTHRSLVPAAASYAAFIAQEYGVTTSVVDVQDVYNSFSYGMFNPEALRLYLRTLSRAGSAPQYLLLAGDANIDYKRTSGAFRENLVPSYGNPASDCAFTAFDRDGTEQEFAVGRLPVRIGEELEAYQQRHQKYRNAEPDIWNKTGIHFSGGEYYENDTELSYYRNVNRELIEQIVQPIPFAGQSTHFYKTAEPPSEFGPKSDAFRAQRMAEGGLFISYVGHSATTTWDNSIDDPAMLENESGRGSLITDFGCSSAKFAEPNVMSFAEKCIVPVDAQAMAYVGNAAFGYRSSGTNFPRIFYRQLLQNGVHRLGDAHRVGREELLTTYGRSQANLNAVTMSTLIGDPILDVAVSELPDFTFPDNAVQPETELFTDVLDTLRFRVAVENLGRGVSGNLGIMLSLLEGADVLLSRNFDIPAPLLHDTVAIALPSPRRPGSFRLQLTLDPESLIEEFRENNNATETEVLLLSSQFVVVNAFPSLSSGDWSDIRLLNPVTSAEDIQGLRWEFSHDANFPSPVAEQGDYGNVISSIALPSAIVNNSPYFWRVKADPDAGMQAPLQMLHQRGSKGVVFADSISFALCSAARLSTEGGSIRPLASLRTLRVSSAGALAGNTASILRDGEELLPYPGLDGYGVAVIDSINFDILEVRVFSTRSSAAQADSLAAFLDAIGSGSIVAIATSGDPLPNVERFAAQIKRLGSVYIDQLDDRGSWSLIGHQGAAAGSVAEINYGRLVGRAVLDTSITALPPVGTLRTPTVGPVHAWVQLSLAGEQLDGAVVVRVLGVRSGVADSLLLRSEDLQTDLSGIDAEYFAGLRLEVDLIQRELSQQPVLRAVDLSLQHLPELAMNYQSVSLEADSMEIGSAPALRLGVINAGEATAPPASVQLHLLTANGTPVESRSSELRSLAFLERSDTLISFAELNVPGRYRLQVEIDPGHTIREQYSENNFFQLGFTVKGDTTSPELTLQIDGSDPFEGDYIAARPEVVLSLLPGNSLPVTDPQRFIFSVDETPIPGSDPRVSFDAGTPGSAAQFRIALELENGEHLLQWNATDMLGNLAYPEDRTVRVFVDASSRILQVFPYPSPFADKTDITFMLSGESAPREGELRFYTVTGRRIRNVIIPPGSLRIGFNTIGWDGRDEDGDQCANGVYFYKILIRGDDADIEYVGRVARIR